LGFFCKCSAHKIKGSKQKVEYFILQATTTTRRIYDNQVKTHILTLPIKVVCERMHRYYKASKEATILKPGWNFNITQYSPVATPPQSPFPITPQSSPSMVLPSESTLPITPQSPFSMVRLLESSFLPITTPQSLSSFSLSPFPFEYLSESLVDLPLVETHEYLL